VRQLFITFLFFLDWSCDLDSITTQSMLFLSLFVLFIYSLYHFDAWDFRYCFVVWRTWAKMFSFVHKSFLFVLQPLIFALLSKIFRLFVLRSWTLWWVSIEIGLLIFRFDDVGLSLGYIWWAWMTWRVPKLFFHNISSLLFLLVSLGQISLSLSFELRLLIFRSYHPCLRISDDYNKSI